MKLGYTALAVVLACGFAAAQETEKKSKTKVTVEDGKTITVTGCVERGAGGEFLLTNAAGKDGALGSYVLAKDDDSDDVDDLKDHVGQRVEITGKRQPVDLTCGRPRAAARPKTCGAILYRSLAG